ncbi:35581_t:CDS:2, partial [Gigaspora margarita]
LLLRMPAILDSSLVERDIGQEIHTRITPTEKEIRTLIIIGIYIVVIMVLWRMPILKYILYPFKIEGIELDPDEGGVTRMRGGIQCCTLPAGYLGSSLIGAILVFCGFNVTASKVASIVLGVLLIILLFWAKNWLTRGITVFFVIVIVALWLIKNGEGLVYFVLFVGVMSCLYSLWDIMDDL